MIVLKIGNEERRNGNIEKRWIAQQLNKRNGRPVCIELVIRQGDVKARFKSGACARGTRGSNGPKPNRKEQKLFELWDQKGLNGTDIKPGMLISFMKQYERYV